jgi:hypothetical protein
MRIALAGLWSDDRLLLDARLSGLGLQPEISGCTRTTPELFFAWSPESVNRMAEAIFARVR